MDLFPRDNCGVCLVVKCPNCDKTLLAPNGNWAPEQEFKGVCNNCMKEFKFTYGDLIDA